MSVVLKGTGAWIYGMNPRYVNEITTFNKVIKDPDRAIRYLFCKAGVVEDGQVKGFSSDILAYYKQKLPECEIYPNIDGHPSINGMLEKDIARLGKDLAGLIEQNKDVTGLHLDIEPYEPTQLLLLEEYRKHTDKPVNLSVSINSQLDKKLFQLTNFVVLMNYDYDREPERYIEISNQAIDKILGMAQTCKGKVMVGIPAIATHYEYQYKVSKSDLREREHSGHTMADYLSAALSGSRPLVRKYGTKHFMGYSIWAFHSESEPIGFGNVRNTHVYYPCTIGLREWELLLNGKS